MIDSTDIVNYDMKIGHLEQILKALYHTCWLGILGSDCGSVGRAVASDTIDPQSAANFIHCQLF